eukprot:TRINITY_DN5638_c0_g1_i2.p1 TRINITY_DN5638_c0_g1~~TRINITY_DN5638_c0_g1_i2.p1  ORF type:complete len:264 (-),score=42.03 TRINITY_DN5638_c0_g1_i2:419-1210(-)
MATHERRGDLPVHDYENTLRPLRPPPGTTIRKFTYVQELSDSRPPSFRRRQTTPRQNESTAHITYAPEFDEDGNMLHSGSVYDKGKSAPLRSWKPVNLHVDMSYEVKTPHRNDHAYHQKSRPSTASGQPTQSHSQTQLQPTPPPARPPQMPRPQTAGSNQQNTGPLSFPVRMPPTISTNRSSRCRRPRSASFPHRPRDDVAAFASSERFISLTPPTSRPSSPSLIRPFHARRPHSAPRIPESHSFDSYTTENYRSSHRFHAND